MTSVWDDYDFEVFQLFVLSAHISRRIECSTYIFSGFTPLSRRCLKSVCLAITKDLATAIQFITVDIVL